MSRSSTTANCYPPESVYSRWQAAAAERDMGMSEFMQSMVEAGLKADQGFVDPTSLGASDSVRDLRQQRADLRGDLEHARDRIEELESQVYDIEREELRRFVDANPGTSYDEILAHMRRTVPERLPDYIEAGEFVVDRLPEGGDGYFASPEAAEEHR